MGKIFFTADTHFNHARIIEYCNRPFKDVDEMNEIEIKNWNARVKDDDTIFVIGDFCFKERDNKKFSTWETQLKGSKIFIKGNHDNNNSTKTKIQSLTIDISNQSVYLVHDPAEMSNNHFINLVGHIHGLWKIKRIAEIYPSATRKHILYNVGVDVHKFMPITWQEIEKEIAWFRRTGKEQI